jgi:hypothetical protein
LWLVAADAPVQDSQTAIVLGVIALLTAVLVAVVGGVFTLLNTRASRTTPPDQPAPPQQQPMDLAFRDFVVGELAVARERLDDHDEDLAIKDRRHDQVERYLDLDNPNWRAP